MNNIIGIDIGAYSTKIIEATSGKKALTVLNKASFLTPFNDQGEFQEELFFKELHKTIPLSRLRSSQVVLSPPKASFNAAVFDLPKMPKKDLKSVILREARNRIFPAPTKSDIVRYDLRLFKDEETGASRFEVVAGSMQEEVIQRFFSLFQKKGTKLEFIGSTSSSLISYCEYLKEPPYSYSIIDVGFENTNIVIFSKGTLVFTRSIPFGAYHFINSIQTKLKVTKATASQLFVESSEQADKVIEENWSYLISEIRRSFAYHQEKTGNKESISKIIFSGTVFKNLLYKEHIKKNMRGNIQIFGIDIVKNIKISNKYNISDLSLGPSYAVSLGLILNLQIKYPALNFLPLSVRKKKKKRKIKIHIIQGTMIVIFALGFLSFSLFIRKNVLERKLQTIKSSFSLPQYQNYSQVNNYIKSIRQKTNNQNKFIEKVNKINKIPMELFDLIVDNLPADAHLTVFEMGGDSSSKQGGNAATKGGSSSQAKKGSINNLKIVGIIEDSYEDATKKLTSFMKKINKSQMFDELNSDFFKLENEPLLIFKKGDLTTVKKREFTIEATIKEEVYEGF
ncbi:MAG: pilus assembly protein PilM [Candidatus Omnitrophica bacterium]|nr:pilus assembly protein PilM [Candidatus Omnitrophota bacterium]MCF7894125.1 pilus assembly protein PilM [Candidatus Omnitrophota bacterium]